MPTAYSCWFTVGRGDLANRSYVNPSSGVALMDWQKARPKLKSTSPDMTKPLPGDVRTDHG